MSVRLKKNGKTLTVPAGAVKKYISAGWQPAETEQKPKFSKPPVNEVNPELEKLINDEEEYEEIEVDPEELAQRPLSELDRDELRILAEYKGIDTSDMTTSKQLRSAIKLLD